MLQCQRLSQSFRPAKSIRQDLRTIFSVDFPSSVQATKQQKIDVEEKSNKKNLKKNKEIAENLCRIKVIIQFSAKMSLNVTLWGRGGGRWCVSTFTLSIFSIYRNSVAIRLYSSILAVAAAAAAALSHLFPGHWTGKQRQQKKKKKTHTIFTFDGGGGGRNANSNLFLHCCRCCCWIKRGTEEDTKYKKI